jgi:hypothetical protein
MNSIIILEKKKVCWTSTFLVFPMLAPTFAGSPATQKSACAKGGKSWALFIHFHEITTPLV